MLTVGKVAFNQYCASCSVCGTPFKLLPENRIMWDPGCSKLAEAISLVFGKEGALRNLARTPSVCLSVLIGRFVVVIIPPKGMQNNAIKCHDRYHSYPLKYTIH